MKGPRTQRTSLRGAANRSEGQLGRRRHAMDHRSATSRLRCNSFNASGEHVDTCIYTYTGACVYIYIYTCLHMCAHHICMCIHSLHMTIYTCVHIKTAHQQKHLWAVHLGSCSRSQRANMLRAWKKDCASRRQGVLSADSP